MTELEKNETSDDAEQPLSKSQPTSEGEPEGDEGGILKDNRKKSKDRRCCSCWTRMSYCNRAVLLGTAGILLSLCALAFYVGIYSPNWWRIAVDKPAPKGVLHPPNPEVPQPPSPSTQHVFQNAAVCSDSDVCSRIGRDVFTRGGHVVDAAIATMFCLGLTNMQSMGIGGGFIMNLYLRDQQKAYTLDAREISASAAFESMHLHDPNTTIEGPLSLGTPGELMGYWEAHQRFGRLPWRDLVAPAIKVCEQGFPMSRHMEDSTKINPRIQYDPMLRSMLFNETTGTFRRMGSIVRPTKLCETLRIVAENGGTDLYNGTLADLFVEDLKELGSIITREDLQAYRVKWSDSIPIKMNGDTMYIIPPPGSGLLLGFIMKILKGYHFTPENIATKNETIRTYHRIIEAFKWTYGKRTEIGDPDFVDITQLINDLTSDEYAEQIRLKIEDTFTSQEPKDYGGNFHISEDHGTAHISLLAPNGDAVSVTSSVNFYFGCGNMGNRTGIIFNSGMDDFSSPGLKNYFGLPGSPPNYIRPRKRALSSMSPTIVVGNDGNVKLVIGAAGGTKITTAVAMATMRILWFGQDVKEAVDAPRFHHQLIPMWVDYEYGMEDYLVDGLEKLGHKTNRYNYRGSIICAIKKNDTAIYGNADFRKEGDVFGF
ncbi:glutathione hydrolase 1 proenzyme-like isoform X2 [Lutzomyia longipalpis]|uniref:glutathione hydrolase 1 proenzyme-like isoform X2 n=1 Tax=Lutzomyia longipalpis TaxID=7200 RepID=UPI002483BC1A|nr:glutathione hydrolase 1 proenzyme-like isoform X2 [Lutzomyia longipalpis]